MGFAAFDESRAEVHAGSEVEIEGRLLFNVLTMIAEFESDLIRMRTREGLKSPKPKNACAASSPSSNQPKPHLVELWRAGRHTSAELADLFDVARSTIHWAVQRAGETKPA